MKERPAPRGEGWSLQKTLLSPCSVMLKGPVTPGIHVVMWKEQEAENLRTVSTPLAHGLASLTFFAYKMHPQLG